MNSDEKRKLRETRAKLDALKAKRLGHSESTKAQVSRANKRIDAARKKTSDLEHVKMSAACSIRSAPSTENV